MTRIHTIPVVYYHSVGPVISNWHRNFLTLKPEVFRKHLEYLSHNYTIISLKELWHIRTGQSAPVRKPLVITFDDGYSDNFTWAFPILKRYGIKATIFVSPAFVDDRDIRRTANDTPGFLSWSEMKVMIESGLVEIGSHTMTHARYFVSDCIRDFHHPERDILHPAINIFPERRTDHIGDPCFEKLLPYGYPIFEEASAVTAKRVRINEDFIKECLDRLSEYDFSQYDFRTAYGLIEDIYLRYRNANSIITSRESDEAYVERLREEIFGSKLILEENLGRSVEFLCWPHGDNNDMAHRMAIDAGYLMTTKGKAKGISEDDTTRIPERIGVNLSSPANRLKTVCRLRALSGEFPYRALMKAWRINFKDR